MRKTIEQQTQSSIPLAKNVFLLSEQLVEPGLMREARLKALEAFQQTPWPTGKEEIWRKTKIRHFQGTHFPVPDQSFIESTADSIAEIPPAFHSLLGDEKDFSGALIHETGQPSRRILSGKKQNILLFDLPHAIRFFPEELALFFTEKSEFFPSSKLELLHEAFWNSGAFLRVSQSTHLAKPVLYVTQISKEIESLFPQTILCAEPNSAVSFVEIVRSQEHSSLRARNARVKILAEAGARVQYYRIDLSAGHETTYTSIQVLGKRDSFVRVGLFQLGGGISKTHIRTDLPESGAQAEIQGLYFASKNQHQDIQTFQNHFASHTDSNLHLKGAASDHAKAIYRGVIHIHPNAQETSAYQLNNNLLLSSEAHVDSNPVLEIEANEVRCSHGSSAGPVDKDQLFYLQSRGIPLEKSRRLLVEGFFNPMLDLLPTESLREQVQQGVDEKIPFQKDNLSEDESD